MWLSVEELFGNFDVTSRFQFTYVSGKVPGGHSCLVLKKQEICALNHVELSHDHEAVRFMYQSVDCLYVGVSTRQLCLHLSTDIFL